MIGYHLVRGGSSIWTLNVRGTCVSMGPTCGTTVAWTAARTSAARNRCFIGLIISYCSSIKEYRRTVIIHIFSFPDRFTL
jgi:hypothetical protein